jgi:hypothetical protein
MFGSALATSLFDELDFGILSILLFLGVGVLGSGRLCVSVSLWPVSTFFPLVLGGVSKVSESAGPPSAHALMLQ